MKVLADRYRLEEELARNWSGVVWRARDMELDQEVAVKRFELNEPLPLARRTRFLRQLERLSQAPGHPHVLRAVQVGDDAGCPYLISELLPGARPLGDREPGPLDLPRVLRIGAALARGLAHVHGLGIVHQALTADSMLVSPALEVFKLTGFGVACLEDLGRLLDAPPPAAGERDPTRRFWYLAPEQAGLRRPIGPRTDLYAVGTILFELLAGAPPFADDDPGAVIHGHLARKPAALSADLPAALRDLVGSLLEKEPVRRPASAEVVLQALLDLQDEPCEVHERAPEPGDAECARLRWAVPLVAREKPLAALASVVSQAEGGEGRVVLLAGEAGQGKSRLIDALSDLVQEAGGRLILGKCGERTRPRPLAPFVEAIADCRAQLRGLPREPRQVREGYFQQVCPPVLTTTSSEDWSGSAPFLPGGHDSRTEQFVRCTTFLTGLAALESTLVLAIDDLQWADEGTLELFTHLAAAAPDVNLVVVGAYRPQLSARASDTLERVRGFEPTPLTIELGPLTPPEARRMVLAHLGDTGPSATEVARTVQERVGGNPLHLRQVLQALVELGGLTRDASAWKLGRLDDAVLQAGVTEVIRVRAERLGTEAYQALTQAAVIGRSFSLDLLVDVSGLRPSRALFALEQGQEAGLVVEDGGRLAWNFTHDKVREALYDAVPPQALEGLHGAIAEAILAEAQDDLAAVAAEVADHFTRSGQPSRALEYHLLAGKHALAAFVLHDAAVHITLALDHLDPEREPLRFAETAALYASARRYAGEYVRLRALLERALPIAVAHGDAGLEVELTGRLAMVAEMSGSPDAPALIRRFADVSDRIGNDRERAPAIARAMLGYHHFDHGETYRAMEEIEAALAVEDCLEAAEVANLTSVLGYCHARTGRFEKGVALMKRAIERAQAINPSVVGWTTTTLGALYMEWGRWEDGLPLLERARALLHQSGDVFYLYIARATHGIGLVLAGGGDEGLDPVEEALAYGEAHGVRSFQLVLRCIAGEAEISLGRVEAGLRRIRQALADAEVKGDRLTQARGRRVLAEQLLVEDPAGPEVLGEAERLASEASRIAEAAGVLSEHARALVVLGRLQERRGARAEARASWARARQVFQDCHMPRDLLTLPDAMESGEGEVEAALAPAVEPSPGHDLLHRRGFQTIVKVSRMVGATLDLDPLLDRALGAVVEVFGAERGFILLDEGQGLAVRAARGAPREAFGEGDLAPARELVEEVRRNGAVAPGGAPDRSSLCAPIGAAPARAVLYLENRLVEDLFGGDDALVLEAIAAQLAIGIESAHAYREIARLKENLEQENVYLKEELASHAFPEIVGEGQALRRALRRVEQVAPLDTTVLLRGETGVGKELFARAIHDHSQRRKGPLVRVNCSALNPALITSELFGHERGAFTGANARKRGRFELARGGTLFLDEIGDVPLETQLALLRVLEEGEFERVGGTTTLRVDVRVVAATNRDLESAAAAGEFRSDLLYRLNGFTIVVPPLRERKEDIPLLAQRFALEHARRLGKSVTEVSARALEALAAYDWPGNIRELRHFIERAVILCEGSALTLEEGLPGRGALVAPAASEALVTLEEHERRYIRSVLEHTGWTIKGERGAARVLGMPPSTLTSRMKKLGIQRPARA